MWSFLLHQVHRAEEMMIPTVGKLTYISVKLGKKFTFAFIASSHLNVGLRYIDILYRKCLTFCLSPDDEYLSGILRVRVVSASDLKAKSGMCVCWG